MDQCPVICMITDHDIAALCADIYLPEPQAEWTERVLPDDGVAYGIKDFTLLNKLVRTVGVSASRTIQTVSVSIDLYVEIRFNPGSLFRRNRFQSMNLDAFRCPVPSSDRLIHGRFKVECCSSAFRNCRGL
jgi:hypothetical protein